MYDDDPDRAVADVGDVEDAPVVAAFAVDSSVVLTVLFADLVSDFSEDAPVVAPLTVDSVVASVRLGFTQTLFWYFPDLFEDRELRELECPDL